MGVPLSLVDSQGFNPTSDSPKIGWGRKTLVNCGEDVEKGENMQEPERIIDCLKIIMGHFYPFEEE